MLKKYTAFGREFEAKPSKDGYDVESPSLHVQNGGEWKGKVQKFWCPKHVFKLFYTEVKS